MVRPTILFASNTVARTLSEATGIRYMTLASNADLSDDIEYLKAGNTVICDENIMLMGWSVPDALIVFLEGFPDDPKLKAQAMGRVRRVIQNTELPQVGEYYRRHPHTTIILRPRIARSPLIFTVVVTLVENSIVYWRGVEKNIRRSTYTSGHSDIGAFFRYFEKCEKPESIQD
jgi:hypothetical protein